VDRGGIGNKLRTGAFHHRRNVKQVIEMRVRHEHGVSRFQQMFETFVQALPIRCDRLIEYDWPETDPSEIRIDQQNVVAGFELVTIHSEIGHTDCVVGRSRVGSGISHNQGRIFFQARLRDICAKQQTADSQLHHEIMSGRLILALISSLDDIKHSQDVIDFIVNLGIYEDAVSNDAMVNSYALGCA
jgi:hypothetical protein